MFCGKCGNQLPDNALFCGKCGNKIENPKVNTAKTVKRKGQASNRVKIAISVIALVIICFGFIRIFMRIINSTYASSAMEIELNDKGQIIKVYENPSNNGRKAYFDYAEDGKLCMAVLETEGLKEGIKTEVDTNGNVIRKIEYENGKIRTDTTYDINGNKIEEKTYGDEDENESGQHIGWKLNQHLKYEYNSDNTCINVQEYNSEGILELDIRFDNQGNPIYAYDLVKEGEDGGYLDVWTGMFAEGTEEEYVREFTYRNTYNSDGTLSQVETYDVNGNFYARRCYWYQTLNNAIVCTRYERENENKFVEEIEMYDYDTYGNISGNRIEYHSEEKSEYKYRQSPYELSYEENTILSTGGSPSNWIEDKYEYIFDNNGGMIEKRFDDDGKLLSLSEYKGVEYMRIPYVQNIETIYDGIDIEVNPGVLVKKTEYGEDDGGETIEITEYDNEGNMVQQIWVDSEGASCKMYYDTISLPLLLSGEMSVDSNSNLLGIYYAPGDYDENTGVFTPSYEWIYDKDNTIVGKRDKQSGRIIKYRYHYEDERHFTIYEDN